MVRSKLLPLFLASAVSLSCASMRVEAQAGKAKPLVVPNAALALPAGCSVKVRWVCPPLYPEAVKGSTWYSLRYTVDSSGTPWLGYQDDMIVNPVKQYRFRLSQHYTDLVCLDNGVFLVATGADLGFAVPPAKLTVDSSNVPDGLFQPIASLPAPGCRLYAGSGGCAYLVTPEKAGHSDVFLLRPGKAGLRGYTRVFSAPGEVTAVAGDGNSTFVAMDGLIVKVAGSTGVVSRFHAEPRGSIWSMAYLPGTGLFFSTSGGVHYAGAKSRIQLMAAEEADVCVQKGSLYVLFSGSLGVLALDGIQDLKRFDTPIKGAPAAAKDVKITAIRFFEAGKDVPQPSARQYGTQFDVKSTRFVYCQADLQNLQYQKRHHKQAVTMRLYREGQERPEETHDTAFDFKTDVPSLSGWLRFGDEEPGAFYPRVYTVKVSLNDVPVGAYKFTVVGKPSLALAAGNGDSAMVDQLVKAGSNVNEADKDGLTPLMCAARAADANSVKLLLAAGANVNAKAADGDTALTMAGFSWKDNAEVASLLLEAGADVNAQGRNGDTALSMSAIFGKSETVSLLLQHGADPNKPDTDRPLHAIASWMDAKSCAAMAELLLAHGADPDAKDVQGRSAMFAALDHERPELVSVLIEHGADVNATGKEFGVEHSVLGDVLDEYKINLSDRAKRVKVAEIATLLQKSGADLNTAEFGDAYFPGVEQVLDTRHMVRLVEMSERAAVDFQPDSPVLRKAVIRGLLNAACRQLSAASDDEGYYGALNLLDDATSRARAWGLTSSCAEIYFNKGVTWLSMGKDSQAKQCLQDYLDVAPAGACAARARELLRQIQ